ncbi:MAG: aldolase/citrate lyase family protein [Hyphomicrobiaceae bacterium]|nr:aldolase/citrate lyase family protein [Hyphomicrobiaceae bacterium]
MIATPALINPVLETMRAGKPAFGLSVRSVRSIDIARIARASGHQFLFIDGQHGVFNAETVCNLASAALAIGVAPLARVKSLSDPETPVLLDNGVSGIVFPDINTPEEARRAVEICRFPPIGRRSVGANFPQYDGRSVASSVSVPAINGTTVVCVMVETKRGLDNLEAIAAVPGVDVVHIGTNDLMADLGKPGQLDDPAVAAALDRAIAATRAAGNFAGCGGIRDTAKQAHWIGRGIRFLTTQTDIALLHAGAKAWIDAVNATLGKV